MSTSLFITIIIAISFLGALPIVMASMIYRQDARMRFKVILASAIIEGFLITAFIVYVFLILGGLQ